MDKLCIQYTFSVHDWNIYGPTYYFRVTSYRTDSGKFCIAKIKKYGQCCQIYFESYSLKIVRNFSLNCGRTSIKEHNDL